MSSSAHPRLRAAMSKLQVKRGKIVKITVEQAVNSTRALEHLNTACVFEQGLGIAFALASNEVVKVVKAYAEERQKLAKNFAKRDENDKPMKRIVVTREGEQEIFDMDDDAQERFNEANKAALAQQVEVNVSPVLRSQLAKEKLPGFVYATLDWLIVAEVPKPAPAEAA